MRTKSIKLSLFLWYYDDKAEIRIAQVLVWWSYSLMLRLSNLIFVMDWRLRSFARNRPRFHTHTKKLKPKKSHKVWRIIRFVTDDIPTSLTIFSNAFSSLSTFVFCFYFFAVSRQICRLFIEIVFSIHRPARA